MSVNINATARSLLLSEFVSAFFLAMRYFFKPKPTLNYPFEKVMTRRNFSPMATAGSASLQNQSNSTRRTGDVRA